MSQEAESHLGGIRREGRVATLAVMSESEVRSEQYAKALLRDPDFARLLEDDLAAERRGDVDPGLTREEFLAKYKDLLEPPAE